MQASDGLALRDIHAAVSPPWWPPAPGWWMVAGAALACAAVAAWWWRRRRRRAAAIARLFDDAIERADTPAARIAAISELLRRAARRRDPAADRLHGPEWRVFLDRDAKQPLFAGDLGALLDEGPYRRAPDDGEVERLRAAARIRFVEWMGGKR